MAHIVYRVPFYRQWPQPATFETTVDATVSTWAGIWNQQYKAAYRSNPKRSVDVLNITEPEDGWRWTVNSNIIRTWIPVFDQMFVPRRADDRKKIDVKNVTEPEDGWRSTAVSNVIRTWIPIFDQEMSVSFVAREKRKINVASINTPDTDWLGAFIPPAFDVTTWPSIEQLLHSFRSPDSKKLRVDNVTEPEDGWRYPAATTPTYIAVFTQAMKSYRAPEKAKLDLTRLFYPDNVPTYFHPTPPPPSTIRRMQTIRWYRNQ